MKSFQELLSDIGEIGIVEQVRYPLVVATGLPNIELSELVVFETGQIGQVFMIEREEVEILLLSQEEVAAGSRLARTNEFFSVPVGEGLLGGMIDPMGNSISSEYMPPEFSERRPID